MSKNDKTRVLLLNDHLGWDGQIHGVARLFLLWAVHLNPEKYDVRICILRERNDLSRPFDEKGIKIVFLQKSKYDPSAAVDLIKLIRKEKIDVMHVQGYGSTTLGRLAGMVTGVPMIVHFHDTRDYYPFIQRVSDRLMGRFAHTYLAVSKSARACWAKRYHIDVNKVLVVPNCTSFDDFIEPDARTIAEERERWGIAPDCRVVGTLTRLFEGKGTHYLLKAAPAVLKAFPTAMFVIVGDGPLRQELEDLARELGIRRQLIFTGYAKQVAPILGMFEIDVLTSYHSEGSPLSVIEAMSMGKPVIVTDIVDLIEDGVDGIVIPSRNSEILAEKITYLLNNPNDACRLGAAARLASKRFDVKNCVRHLEEIYDSCAVHRNAPNSGS